MEDNSVDINYNACEHNKNEEFELFNDESTQNENESQCINNFGNTAEQNEDNAARYVYKNNEVDAYKNYMDANIPRINYQELYPCYTNSLTTCFSEQPYNEQQFTENYDTQDYNKLYKAYEMYSPNFNYNIQNSEYADMMYNQQLAYYGYDKQLERVYNQQLLYTITANDSVMPSISNGNIAECSTGTNSCNSSVAEVQYEKPEYTNEAINNQLYQYNHQTSGISGVKFQPSDNRWIARWTTSDGKRACKSFSVNIYGFEQAKSLAINARHKGVLQSGRSFCNRERQHAMRSGVGIIGIRFDKTQARWVSSYYEGGKRKFRYFTVKDYGYEEAKQRAILWKTCNDERLIQSRR